MEKKGKRGNSHCTWGKNIILKKCGGKNFNYFDRITCTPDIDLKKNLLKKTRCVKFLPLLLHPPGSGELNSSFSAGGEGNQVNFINGKELGKNRSKKEDRKHKEC